jgi:hypothetical protein
MGFAYDFLLTKTRIMERGPKKFLPLWRLGPDAAHTAQPDGRGADWRACGL